MLHGEKYTSFAVQLLVHRIGGGDEDLTYVIFVDCRKDSWVHVSSFFFLFFGFPLANDTVGKRTRVMPCCFSFFRNALFNLLVLLERKF